MSTLLDELLRAKVQMAGAAPENSDVLATLLRSRLDVRADGTVAVLDASGNVRVGGGPHYRDMTVNEAVAEMAAAKPTLFSKAEPVSAAAEKTADDDTMTARAARDSRKRQATAAKPAGIETNPFMRRSWNVTQQVLLRYRDPEKAARLEREAAAVPAHLDKPFLDIRHP